MKGIHVAPSILAADFGRLGEVIAEAQAGGADLIHVDVMDGHFVPNISMGPVVVAAARRATDLPLDVHLMISQPERYVGAFADAGADRITVHAEVASHLHRLLQQVHEAGALAGLALNPLTPLDVVEGALPYLDQLLLMTVNPGFGGQAFIPASLERIRTVRALRDAVNRSCLIEVDGGIAPDTAGAVCEAGAQVLVAGSAIFGGPGSVADNIAALRAAAERGAAERGAAEPSAAEPGTAEPGTAEPGAAEPGGRG
ncbi:MAG TPA: ribulose-phosphate 3-epimerase [Trueperaceae bacterium]|nr:ribulose-phosphate 3-epimerase [Trueperaceae bacterium]